MSIPRWTPRRETTAGEERLMRRLRKQTKLYLFLREHRLELFDADFQDELAAMYRDSGEGKAPVPPAQLAMTVLLQAYAGVSDAQAVEATVMDRRWQLVLDVLGQDEPAFSQGTLQRFRERLIAHDMDRRLLERTVELAKKFGGFDYRKLPMTVRLAVDSRPLEGAGRVEDTFNLLGHAARKVLQVAAALADCTPEELAQSIGAPALAASSIKRGLDINWNDTKQKADAIKVLVMQIERLEAWVLEHLPEQAEGPPLFESLATLARLREQDLEPDPDGGGPRVRRGVASDRQISVEDPDMRHGRKSKSKTIKGYKSHLGTDLDTGLIVACAITPANRPEAEALPAILEDVSLHSERNALGELHIDRGYLASEIVRQLHADHVPIVAKPWQPAASDRFTKSDFKIHIGHRTITCPAGHTEKIVLGAVTRFPAETCDGCTLRSQCTGAAPGSGRTISIAHDEPLQKKLRLQIATSEGRAQVRERVGIEHRLAHHARRQGPKARYRGVRKNVFDTRRHAATLNLEQIQLADAA
jgi:hypothetical protein